MALFLNLSSDKSVYAFFGKQCCEDAVTCRSVFRFAVLHGALLASYLGSMISHVMKRMQNFRIHKRNNRDLSALCCIAAYIPLSGELEP